MALACLLGHFAPRVAAGGKFNIWAHAHHGYAAGHGAGVSAKHVQARARSNDLNFHFVACSVVECHDIFGIVKRHVHKLWIVLVNMDGDAVHFTCGHCS